ncbi:hypothetical protein VTI74DRAFT_1742 [Chaetomium olivicolor]
MAWARHEPGRSSSESVTTPAHHERQARTEPDVDNVGIKGFLDKRILPWFSQASFGLLTQNSEGGSLSLVGVISMLQRQRHGTKRCSANLLQVAAAGVAQRIAPPHRMEDVIAHPQRREEASRFPCCQGLRHRQWTDPCQRHIGGVSLTSRQHAAVAVAIHRWQHS